MELVIVGKGADCEVYFSPEIVSRCYHNTLARRISQWRDYHIRNVMSIDSGRR
jgi:hypothetical protein